MDQLVQAALDAANQGDKNKAADLIKQAFEANPNDIDSLLALAAIAEEAGQKRRVLNRVLSLDPINKAAREISVQLDRAELLSYRSQTAHATPLQKALNGSLDEPLLFRFSKTWIVALYMFTIFSCCGTLWYGTKYITDGLPFFTLGLILGLTALTVSSKVEVNNSGIQTFSVTGKSEIEWNEIVSINVNSARGILELHSAIGDSVNIPTRIKGYRDILKILRQKRPDLFPVVGYAPIQPVEQPTVSQTSPLTTSNQPVPTPSLEKRSEEEYSMPILSLNLQTTIPDKAISEGTASIHSTQKTTDTQTEKPLTFALPLFWRIFMYAFPIFFGCIGLLIAIQNVLYGLPFLGLALIFVLAALAFSPKVEITETSIRASGLFDSPETQWNEIVQMKSNPLKRRLDLIKPNGEIVGISTQVSGYPRIIEILRQKRPDLFNVSPQPAQPSVFDTSLEEPMNTSTEHSFTGIKIFKKNSFAQYGLILLMIPLCVLGVWFLVARDDKFVGIGIGLIAFFFMVMSLFSIHHIKVEPNKLTTESFFTQKEYTANQIKEIRMKTVRSRHGVATNFVSIQPVEGSDISMAGFPEGDELIYGVLHDWWETYRNR